MPSQSDPQDLPENPEDPQAAALEEGIPIPEDIQKDIQIQVVDLGERRRQLQGSVHIPVERERIWQVLTDYDRLAEFIPNLVESRVIGYENGRKLVRQVGSQKLLFAKFSATVVLAVEEIFPEQLRFQKVEGDFLIFEGFWDLSVRVSGTESFLPTQQTLLTYHLQVKPPRRMPIGMVERRIRQDLAVNLQAIRERSLSL
ncbi:MAG: SRPBCC family protein [Thermostichus sp. DG02_5_bins_236]